MKSWWFLSFRQNCRRGGRRSHQYSSLLGRPTCSTRHRIHRGGSARIVGAGEGGRISTRHFLADPHALRVTVSIAVGMSDENSKPTTQCKLSVKLSADAKVRRSNLDPIACLNYLSTEKHPPTTSDNVSYVRLSLSKRLKIGRFHFELCFETPGAFRNPVSLLYQ